MYGSAEVSPQPETYWGNVNSYGPRACYDEGKRVAEALAWAYRHQHNTDIRISRIFNTYGPRMGAMDGRMVSTFISKALAGEKIPVEGDGSATRSLQYVDDCVRQLAALMNSNYDDGPVNIGNDEEISVGSLADLVADMVAESTGQPRAEITHCPEPVDGPLTRKPDLSLAKRVLGWKTPLSLREGLVKTILWHMKDQSDRIDV